MGYGVVYILYNLFQPTNKAVFMALFFSLIFSFSFENIF